MSSPDTAASGAAPKDAQIFVDEAERATNEYDAAACAALYASDAVFETILEGASDRHVGLDEIRIAWATILGAGRSTGLNIRKTLVARSDDTIVTRWTGQTRGNHQVRGMESWRFDTSGKIVEHHMHSFVNVNHWRNPLQQIRVLFAAPRSAIAFAVSALRAGAFR